MARRLNKRGRVVVGVVCTTITLTVCSVVVRGVQKYNAKEEEYVRTHTTTTSIKTRQDIGVYSNNIFTSNDGNEYVFSVNIQDGSRINVEWDTKGTSTYEDDEPLHITPEE